MKILLLGGTRYIGKQLLGLLQSNGTLDVTVVSRHQPDALLGVSWINIDRYDSNALQSLLSSRYWDIVYDFLCFTAAHAQQIVQLAKNRIGHYVLISSQAVYPSGLNQDETCFKPAVADIEKLEALAKRYPHQSYARGKQAAEAQLYQQAGCKVTAVRFPLVLSEQDPRTAYYLRRCMIQKKILFENPQAYISLIDLNTASQFLFWLKDNLPGQPINACFNQAISLKNFHEILNAQLNNSIAIKKNNHSFCSHQYSVHTGWEEMPTLFYLSVADNWSISNYYATNLGFHFPNIKPSIKIMLNNFIKQSSILESV